MSQPFPRPLAVVIVTYRSAAVIEDCLHSLGPALEGAGPSYVVVADNASGDDTVERVRAFGHGVQVIETGRNGGFSWGVNAGIAAVPGCDVLILNADIRLTPGSVAALRRTLLTPGTGIAAPKLVGTDGELAFSMRRAPTVLRSVGEALIGGHRAGRRPKLGEMVTDPAAYDRPQTADWVTGAAWLISRECLDALGPLDDRYFLYSEETEFMLRAGDKGFAVRYEPAAVAVHIGGEQQTSTPLYILGVANRVRLHRERHGRLRGLMMRLAVSGNETIRALTRGGDAGRRHRAALRELATMDRWPTQPDGRHQMNDRDAPGYVLFAAQDWWYHNRAHSDFQLMRHLAGTRRVLIVNSIGMRMPMPGRSTHTARRILRKLKSVLKFVRKADRDLYVMSPLPIPLYGSAAGRWLNATLVAAQVKLVCLLYGFRRPAVVVTVPTAWDVVRRMKTRSVVFNRSDRHSEFPESDKAIIEAFETGLLENADHVIYASRELMAEEASRTGDRAYFLDHGVDLGHFQRWPDERIPADLRAIPGPRIGFFGALDDFVVDFDLLEQIAVRMPHASLVLIGGGEGPLDRVVAHPNVHWLGFRAYEEIPGYGSGFDVAIMPWLDNDWIRSANPIKLKEYLALGLPVVSTPYPGLVDYKDRVVVGEGPEQFVRAIQTVLAEGPPIAPHELRASLAGADWSSRALELARLIETPLGGSR